jgi:ketosteroid isomerase-like protein
MKLHTFAAITLLAGASTFLVSCGGTESTAADEAAIRDANKKWMELIVKKDGKAIANEIYSENGIMLPPNAPRVAGREELEKSWTGMANIPGVVLSFDTDSLTFAKSGELAVEVGHYSFAAGEGAAKTTELGKTVVTWIRKDGKWQVLTDMFSSDAAPAPAAPAEPAPAPAAEGTAPADAPGAPAAPATTPAPAAPATPPAH